MFMFKPCFRGESEYNIKEVSKRKSDGGPNATFVTPLNRKCGMKAYGVV